MLKKLSTITFVLALASAFPGFALATTNFTANGTITVPAVTFGTGTADMLIFSGSTAASWSFSGGTFTVTDPGSAFTVGSSDSSVKAMLISQSGSNLVCAENSTPGTSAATLPTTAGTYTVTPSSTTQCTNLCSSVSNAASYNSFPTCGAASCNSGYHLVGSGSSATCAQNSTGGGIVGLIGGGSSGAVTPVVPTATPTTDNSALIAQLQAQLQTLVAQLASLGGVPQGVSEFTFTKNVQQGSIGNDVKQLQIYLNAHGFPVAKSGPGSEGNETTKFGAATKVALAKFQKSVGISPASGMLGAKTRAYINAHQ